MEQKESIERIIPMDLDGGIQLAVFTNLNQYHFLLKQKQYKNLLEIILESLNLDKPYFCGIERIEKSNDGYICYYYENLTNKTSNKIINNNVLDEINKNVISGKYLGFKYPLYF